MIEKYKIVQFALVPQCFYNDHWPLSGDTANFPWGSKCALHAADEIFKGPLGQSKTVIKRAPQPYTTYSRHHSNALCSS
jgi:hypothetical protein